MQGNMYRILKFVSEHHSELLLPILSFIIQKIWFLQSWTLKVSEENNAGGGRRGGGVGEKKKSGKIEHAQRAQFCL